MEYKKDLSKKILESLTCVVENNEIFLECKGRKGIVCTAFFNEKPPDPPGVDFKKKFVDVFFFNIYFINRILVIPNLMFVQMVLQAH